MFYCVTKPPNEANKRPLDSYACFYKKYRKIQDTFEIKERIETSAILRENAQCVCVSCTYSRSEKTGITKQQIIFHFPIWPGQSTISHLQIILELSGKTFYNPLKQYLNPRIAIIYQSCYLVRFSDI